MSSFPPPPPLPRPPTSFFSPLAYSLREADRAFSGIILSARLKALGVESVIVDRNPQPGDNWALRYDCLRFHIGRHSCETPYLCMLITAPLSFSKYQKVFLALDLI